ncbi:MAG: pyridoxamine 5'-phosphate oxidase family protein [Erysipelotrichaceae bacterium]|nr:pyridoxamine 5'-phosphate oxidase family protein [Erysipelotrichaceae bacterium]
MNEVWEFLKECGVYYLATNDNGQPRVRPFGTAEIFEGKLYIQTGKKKDCYKQLLADPRAEICCFKDGKWLRLSGKLIPDDRVEAKKDMLDKNPNLRGMYDENDGNTIVLYFEDARAVFSSFTEAPKVIEF